MNLLIDHACVDIDVKTDIEPPDLSYWVLLSECAQAEVELSPAIA